MFTYLTYRCKAGLNLDSVFWNRKRQSCSLFEVDHNKNMMATAFRMANINIIVMIIKQKYIGVGIHVMMIVGQKNPFLVLHIKASDTALMVLLNQLYSYL